ncbi:unnamed protein product [Heterobilharzia americana]|nr:unnamed protein product [Heterobilharzia americana]
MQTEEIMPSSPPSRIALLHHTYVLLFVITAYAAKLQIDNSVTPRRYTTTRLECLRLYSERRQQGFWSDLCNSNELLSPFQIWTTKSICAPGYLWYKSPRYWLIYE